MAIQRLRRPPHSVTLTQGAQTLYKVELSAAPRPAWRKAFLRPPTTLMKATATPALCRLEVVGDRILFRTTPPRLHYWLRWIDRWIVYANSVVEE